MKPIHSTGKVFFILSVMLLCSFKPHALSPNPLVGKWTLTGVEAKGCANSQNNFKNTCPQKCLIVTFEGNGIYAFENGLGSPASGKGTYKIEGNKISVTTNGGIPPSTTFKMEGNTLSVTAQDPTTKCEYVESFIKS
jgi:hypothetical protein